MSRIAFCQACYNEKHGVKSRIAVEHTCDRSLDAGNPSAEKARIESEYRRAGLKQPKPWRVDDQRNGR